MPAMIVAENLTKRFKGRLALRGVSFSVPQGEIFAYLGPNGAGKTTTIRLFTGLSRPTSGRAFVDGLDAACDPRAKRRVGVVAQTINLDLELTVAQNLDIHGRLFGMNRASRERRRAEMLDCLGLADRAGDQIKTLSGGLKRRVMIARALMHEPKALFLDEPTVGLDPDIRRSLWGSVKDVQRRGAAVFLTTHYIEEAEALADRVAFVREGAIVALEETRVLVAAMGKWAAVDLMQPLGARFFALRREALDYAAKAQGGITVRQTTLEDAYLAAVGAAIAPNGLARDNGGPQA